MPDTRRAGSVVASLAFAAAAVALVLLVVSGPGTRLGWWDFRRGFDLLRWAAYGGAAAAVLGLVGLVVAGVRAARGLALIALLVGLTTFIGPWTMQRNARSFPPIHDITTDTDDPPRFVAILERRAGAANPADYGGAEVAAQQKRAYPDLAPIVLRETPGHAFERALSAARSLGWEVVAAEPREGRIEATSTTRWFGFKDDVVIRVRPDPAGARVDARSVSRVGRGDVGANAARIRQLRSALSG